MAIQQSNAAVLIRPRIRQYSTQARFRDCARHARPQDEVHPIHGVAAETSSATISLDRCAFQHARIDDAQHLDRDHGRGFAKQLRALKWTVIERIVWAWILTIPAAGGLAYGLLRLFDLFGWT